MGFGGVLDLIIGLTFTYLLLSLICTGLNETLAGLLNLRGKNLYQGVKALVRDPSFKDLVGEIYAHPVVRSMSKDSRPSYLPSDAFALALLEKVGAFQPANRAELVAPPTGPSQLLAPAGTLARVHEALTALPPGSEIRRVLEGFLDESVKDVAAFRARVEHWFDEGMNRCAGWYKRQAQLISMLVAAVLSFGIAVDTLTVGEALFHNAQLRASVSDAAVAWSQSHGAGAPAGSTDGAADDAARRAAADAFRSLQSLELPIGWSYAVASAPPRNDPRQDCACFWWYWVKRVLGMLVTTVAVSLGAPFWFDALGRVVNIRSAGPPPKRANAPASS